ncbi:hypothetical protein BDV96DRAFT_662330 [Lophiotrema nucula]|uniref:DUF6697 domain-containing protein n=1 Tax=Lophiotrema nucula TaxID=690887 RepID=A0A6A5Z1J2_9PLEO|nr:hypothetical protein BDV96DRAFT_662330 [Lophiotrema nucula]
MSNRVPTPHDLAWDDLSQGVLDEQDDPKSVPLQVSPSFPYNDLVGKVTAVEQDQMSLRHDMKDLQIAYNNLAKDVDTLKRGGWSVEVGPFKTYTADPLSNELDSIKFETERAFSNAYSHEKVDGNDDPLSFGGRSRLTQAPQSVDGSDDNGVVSGINIPTRVLTPPPSSDSTIKASILQVSPDSSNWMPLVVTQWDPLPTTTTSTIPPSTDTVTFHPDFLRNVFGGITWSYGLQYIEPNPAAGPPMLKNRTYYTIDAKYEPCLPPSPGQHGAKLTAFFNENPEEKYGEEGECSFEDVPMFVATLNEAGKPRYTYYGNYTQARWSDKLDYDRMVQVVPAIVKDWWAEELSAQGRPEWVTDALKKHFFPMPTYDGHLLEQTEGSELTVATDVQIAKVEKDVKKYVEMLTEWERDASLKTSLIDKEYILAAFEQADADEPPPLRLWWEYLQCVNWDKDFYDLLVQLQSRNQNYL